MRGGKEFGCRMSTGKAWEEVDVSRPMARFYNFNILTGCRNIEIGIDEIYIYLLCERLPAIPSSSTGNSAAAE